ncbi:MAG: hypothetical protein M1820_003290 [Bogoriella megaspora]|nr:MAG: hypothetical protein M1820_003290 [Bogoriella megaspora]
MCGTHTRQNFPQFARSMTYIAEPSKDWNLHKELFSFTRGRFVSDEAGQLSCRHVNFDMNELVKAAVSSIGAKECISLEKCPDGQYNKAFIFTMDDGRQVIGKVPNPNAGTPHFTTASEVATIDFLRNILQVPAPQVYAWSSNSAKTPVRAEYMIMERVPGVPLGQKWPQLVPADKLKVLLQLVGFQKAWTSTRFLKFGSLYYNGDVPITSEDEYLYIGANGESVSNSRYIVGPATGRDWVDHGRQDLACKRGPWSSVLDYRKAVGCREIMAIETLDNFPKQDVIICGPHLYTPTKMKKLSALNLYQQILPDILPTESAYQFGHLWHDDLHHNNIFVDPENPTKVTGIIDWQSTQIVPLFDHRLMPGLLDCPHSEPEDNLERPALSEDIDSLPKYQKAAILRDWVDRSLLVAWRRSIKNKNPQQYESISFGTTTPGNLLSLGRRLYSLGEAHFTALLLDLKEEWASLPQVQSQGNKPFPLSFSPSDVSKIKDDMSLANRGIEIMQYTAAMFGDLWPDNGLVRHDQYDRARSELNHAKENLIQHLGLSISERKEFEKFWPFDDPTLNH